MLAHPAPIWRVAPFPVPVDRCHPRQRPRVRDPGRWPVSVVVSGVCQCGADGGCMRTSAIAVSGLRKAYGDKTVLDGIDLDVGAGTVFSLLGPNGAGKTTTVNVLTTLMKADGGTVRVAGHDVATEPRAVRAVVGVTGQFAAVDDLLTGEENLPLRVLSDGGVKSLRALLNRLDEHSIDVEEFSVHTPDLDDVFLALTGHAIPEAIAQ